MKGFKLIESITNNIKLYYDGLSVYLILDSVTSAPDSGVLGTVPEGYRPSVTIVQTLRNNTPYLRVVNSSGLIIYNKNGYTGSTDINAVVTYPKPSVLP